MVNKRGILFLLLIIFAPVTAVSQYHSHDHTHHHREDSYLCGQALQYNHCLYKYRYDSGSKSAFLKRRVNISIKHLQKGAKGLSGKISGSIAFLTAAPFNYNVTSQIYSPQTFQDLTPARAPPK